jgi:hypothetical protein
MDINAVSRALHALNMMYQTAFFSLGVSAGLRHQKKYRRLSHYFNRVALRKKTGALIEHDRVLTER